MLDKSLRFFALHKNMYLVKAKEYVQNQSNGVPLCRNDFITFYFVIFVNNDKPWSCLLTLCSKLRI